jgi:hypothetical protein
MDAITDLKQAASISPYEPVRAKILRDLLSPDEQVQLHALESLRDYFGEQCVSYSTLQKCRQYLEKRGRRPISQGLQNGQTTYEF